MVVKKTNDYGRVGQYTVNVEAAPAGITITSASVPLKTGEDGRTATFGVVLDTRPTASVTIPLSSSDLYEGSVSTSSLTFTPANWDEVQTVTVIGRDDEIADGLATYSILLGAATSEDAAYNGFDADDIDMVNVDNDALGWAIQFSGAGSSSAREINVGPDGNVYVSGRFSLTVDFDPGPGVLNLTSVGGENGFCWSPNILPTNSSFGREDLEASTDEK